MKTEIDQIAIRMATDADTHGIAAVVNHAFQAEHDFLASERTSETEVVRLMETSVFLVALQDGEIVGTVQMEVNGFLGGFAMLAVDPQSRRRGIGRALREAAENYCRERGCTEVNLTTGASVQSSFNITLGQDTE